MCYFLRNEVRVAMSDAVDALVEKWVERKRLDTMFDIVKNLMDTMKLSAEQAMDAIKLSDEDREILLKRF